MKRVDYRLSTTWGPVTPASAGGDLLARTMVCMEGMRVVIHSPYRTRVPTRRAVPPSTRYVMVSH